MIVFDGTLLTGVTLLVKPHAKERFIGITIVFNFTGGQDFISLKIFRVEREAYGEKSIFSFKRKSGFN